MNVVVTAGGTIAPIDEVRYIANRSTGRFAAQIAEACLARGAAVWYVHTPTAQLPFQRSASLDLLADLESEFSRLKRIREMYRLCRPRLRLLPLSSGTVGEYSRRLEAVLDSEPIDVVILVMAVSDYEPRPVSGKLSSGAPEMTLHCQATPKVINQVRDWAPDAFLVGFKLTAGASEEELIRQAEGVALASRADLVVANDMRTVREDRHVIHLVAPGEQSLRIGPDEEVADGLVEQVFRRAMEVIKSRSPIPWEESLDLEEGE